MTSLKILNITEEDKSNGIVVKGNGFTGIHRKWFLDSKQIRQELRYQNGRTITNVSWNRDGTLRNITNT